MCRASNLFITKAIIIISLSLLLLNVGFAQSDGTADEHSPAIEDNSFFVEEAYNQEIWVVQHISNAAYFRDPHQNIGYTFTQEWPFVGQEHQVSFTLPYTFLIGNTVSGLGDIMINYRYQFLTKADWITMAPRLSIILPSGDASKGFGMGAAGLQINLPASKRLSESFVTHINAGMTLYPGVSATTVAGNEVRRTLTWYNIGWSTIWLAQYNLNAMFEVVENFASELDDAGEVVTTKELIVNPGMRYAIDVGELQIVPGVSVPIRVNEGETETGMFVYLSLEHPY